MKYKTLFSFNLESVKENEAGIQRFHKDTLFENIVSLKISQVEGDPGFYLFYVDASGDQLIETYHATLEYAMRQAEIEFGLKPNRWNEA